jgi:hypothetical protein
MQYFNHLYQAAKLDIIWFKKMRMLKMPEVEFASSGFFEKTCMKSGDKGPYFT